MHVIERSMIDSGGAMLEEISGISTDIERKEGCWRLAVDYRCYVTMF